MIFGHGRNHRDIGNKGIKGVGMEKVYATSSTYPTGIMQIMYGRSVNLHYCR